jgi:hypothetical protein
MQVTTSSTHLLPLDLLPLDLVAPSRAAFEPPPARPLRLTPDAPFRSSTAGTTVAAGLAETRRLLGEGLVRHVVADVYVARDVPDSIRLRATAAALLTPPRRGDDRFWVTGFTSAVWLYTGWRDPRQAAGAIPELTASPQVPAGPAPGPARLEVIIPAGRNRPPDPWVRARQMQLTGTDVVLIHGVAVTDPVRTAADVARELPDQLAIDVLRHLGELSAVMPGQVMTRLNAMRYARGAARARSIIGAWQNLG